MTTLRGLPPAQLPARIPGPRVTGHLRYQAASIFVTSVARPLEVIEAAGNAVVCQISADPALSEDQAATGLARPPGIGCGLERRTAGSALIWHRTGGLAGLTDTPRCRLMTAPQPGEKKCVSSYGC